MNNNTEEKIPNFDHLTVKKSDSKDEDSFTYFCRKCEAGLLSKDVNEDRTCKKCGTHTDDTDLFDGDPDCKHENDECSSGVRCVKCDGWFCY